MLHRFKDCREVKNYKNGIHECLSQIIRSYSIQQKPYTTESELELSTKLKSTHKFTKVNSVPKDSIGTLKPLQHNICRSICPILSLSIRNCVIQTNCNI